MLHNIYIKNTLMGYSIAKYISYSHRDNWYILPQLALVALESLPKKKTLPKKKSSQPLRPTPPTTQPRCQCDERKSRIRVLTGDFSRFRENLATVGADLRSWLKPFPTRMSCVKGQIAVDPSVPTVNNEASVISEDSGVCYLFSKRECTGNQAGAVCRIFRALPLQAGTG